MKRKTSAESEERNESRNPDSPLDLIFYEENEVLPQDLLSQD